MCTYNIQTWAEYKRPRTLPLYPPPPITCCSPGHVTTVFAVYNRLTLPGAITCTPLLQVAGPAHRRAVQFTTSSQTHRITEACLCHNPCDPCTIFSFSSEIITCGETPSAAAYHATQQQTFPCGIRPSTSRPHPRLPDSFDDELNGNGTGQSNDKHPTCVAIVRTVEECTYNLQMDSYCVLNHQLPVVRFWPLSGYS